MAMRARDGFGDPDAVGVADGGEVTVEDAVGQVDRVAAIDIAKASWMVCVGVPDEDGPGRRVQRVFHCAATSGAILDLGDHLVCQGVTQVVMEATSTYCPANPLVFRSAGWGLVTRSASPGVMCGLRT
jgi:hypothetical protein